MYIHKTKKRKYIQNAAKWNRIQLNNMLIISSAWTCLTLEWNVKENIICSSEKLAYTYVCTS